MLYKYYTRILKIEKNSINIQFNDIDSNKAIWLLHDLDIRLLHQLTVTCKNYIFDQMIIKFGYNSIIEFWWCDKRACKVNTNANAKKW